MALVVIAARSGGPIERGDVIGVYPDGANLGSKVGVPLDGEPPSLVVVQIGDSTSLQRARWVKEHAEDRLIENKAAQLGLNLSDEQLSVIRAVHGPRYRRRLRHRVRGVDFSLIPRARRTRILAGERLRLRADEFEPVLVRRVTQQEEDDVRDPDPVLVEDPRG